MDEALGGKISDYLIKPVNPNQILLSVKKHTEARRLVSEKSTFSYQQQFRDISMQLSDNLNAEEWIDVYKKLVYWDLELANTQDDNIHDIFLSQKAEANQQFCKYYERNYIDWVNGEKEKPLMSPTVVRERLFPLLEDDRPTFMIVIDPARELPPHRPRRNLLQYHPHHHPVRPQQHVLRPYACRNRTQVSPVLGQRGRGGLQKPVRV